MEQAQLQDVMKFHLANFTHTPTPITDQTVVGDILSPVDGFGASNSKNIFRGSIRWTLKKSKLKDKPWPKGWMDLSVEELAGKLL